MFPYIAADARHEIELQSYPSFHGISQTTQGCCCRCGRCCCCWDIVIGHLWSPSHYLFVLQTRSLRICHMPMPRVPINSHQFIMHGATCSPCQYLSCLSPYLLSPPLPFLAWLYHSCPPSIITCCIIAYEYATITNLPPPFDDTTWNLTRRCHGMVDNCCDALETGAFHLACWLSWIILFWPTSHFKYDYRTPLIILIWAGGASRLHLHSLFLAQYGLRLGKYHRQATKWT